MFPIYKDSRTIKKMICQSLNVLRELPKNFEILFIDDGCPKKTEIFAKKIVNNKKIYFSSWWALITFFIKILPLKLLIFFNNFLNK